MIGSILLAIVLYVVVILPFVISVQYLVGPKD
jgi:hypothetical protein